VDSIGTVGRIGPSTRVQEARGLTLLDDERAVAPETSWADFVIGGGMTTTVRVTNIVQRGWTGGLVSRRSFLNPTGAG